MRRISISVLGVLGMLTLVGGCMSTDADAMKAAILKKPGMEARKLVQQGLAELLNGQQVTLADTVFSKENTVIVERKTMNDAQGRPVDGRQALTPADSFSLLKNDQGCYLRHDQSGQTIALPNVECVYLN